jgi:hypothetical protein
MGHLAKKKMVQVRVERIRKHSDEKEEKRCDADEAQ